MRKAVRSLRFFGAWIVATIVLYIVALLSFPVDDTNTLLAPGWYVVLLAVVPVLCGIATLKLNTRAERKKAIASEEPIYDDGDPLSAAVRIVRETGQASASMLQQKLGIGYAQAAKLIEDMEIQGIIGDQERLSRNAANVRAPIAPMVDEYARYGGIDAEILAVDLMEGHQFEHYCADILRKNGYTDVEVTQGSGDQGVDVLAVKDGIKYAIQCKCYASDLGNKPVQEVNAGKVIYHCHVGVVMTNRFFTQGAKDAADATGILLWDRNKLVELIRSAKNLQ